jgi:hypothetical protein
MPASLAAGRPAGIAVPLAVARARRDGSRDFMSRNLKAFVPLRFSNKRTVVRPGDRDARGFPPVHGGRDIWLHTRSHASAPVNISPAGGVQWGPMAAKPMSNPPEPSGPKWRSDGRAVEGQVPLPDQKELEGYLCLLLLRIDPGGERAGIDPDVALGEIRGRVRRVEFMGLQFRLGSAPGGRRMTLGTAAKRGVRVPVEAEWWIDLEGEFGEIVRKGCQLAADASARVGEGFQRDIVHELNGQWKVRDMIPVLKTILRTLPAGKAQELAAFDMQGFNFSPEQLAGWYGKPGGDEKAELHVRCDRVIGRRHPNTGDDTLEERVPPVRLAAYVEAAKLFREGKSSRQVAAAISERGTRITHTTARNWLGLRV